MRDTWVGLCVAWATLERGFVPQLTPWYWDKINVFDGVSPEGRLAFMQRAERRDYRRGEHVFRASDPATRVFFLESGLVKIYHLSPGGAATIFWFCAPGELFGAGGISGSKHQAVYGQAIERSTIYAMSRPAFEQLVEEYPRVGLNVIRLLGARLRLACDSMTDNVTQRTETRLARVLLRLARHWGEQTAGGVRFRVQISHQELGNMIGASRQTVNRVLREFVRQEWLAQQGRTLVLADVAELMAFLERSEKAEVQMEPYRPG